MPEKKHETGYGHPPERNQFKPGQSGNPKGRPKGSKNFNTVLMEELEATVLVKENGASQEISKLVAMIKQTVNKAIQGDDRSTQLVVRLLQTMEQGHKSPPLTRLTEADMETINTFNKRMEKLNAAEDD